MSVFYFRHLTSDTTILVANFEGDPEALGYHNTITRLVPIILWETE